jgi:hypothetical protein
MRASLRPEPLPRIPFPLDAAVVPHGFGRRPHCGQAQGFAEEAVVGPQRRANDAQFPEGYRSVFKQMNAELTRVIARGLELLRMRPPVKFMIARDRHDFRRGISVSHKSYRESQPLACVPTDHDEVSARREGWKPAGPWISKMKVRHNLDLQLLLDCCFSRPALRDRQDC